MYLLDFLFNVCFAPFQKVGNGRFAALIWLSPSLTFICTGSINIILFFLRPIINIKLSAMVVGIGSFIVFAIIAYSLNNIYIKNNRDAGKIRFAILHGLLIPILFIGSIVFFSMSLYKFR